MRSNFIVTEDFLYNPPSPFSRPGIYWKVRKLCSETVPHPETQDGVGVEYYDDVIDRERLKASKGLVRIPRYFASEKDAKNFAAVLGAARPRA